MLRLYTFLKYILCFEFILNISIFLANQEINTRKSIKSYNTEVVSTLKQISKKKPLTLLIILLTTFHMHLDFAPEN